MPVHVEDDLEVIATALKHIVPALNELADEGLDNDGCECSLRGD